MRDSVEPRGAAPSPPRAEATTPVRTVAYLLALVVAALIALLVALRIGGADGSTVAIAQAAFVVAFVVLAMIDLRPAVAIAVLELVLAGASGRWTTLPFEISGRQFMDVVVVGVAVAHLIVYAYRHHARPPLGRYAVHATTVAILLPLIWIPLGIANGWTIDDAVADGNGYIFLAFTLVLCALAIGGKVAWLRRWLLVACAANAVLTGLLIVTALSHAVSIDRLSEVLIGQLDMGGGIAWNQPPGPPGPFRLYLGSGLYLQVGLVLVVWNVIAGRRRNWPWLSLLLCLLVFDLVLSYTRGYWVGAAIGVLLVLLLGMAHLRRAVTIVLAALTLTMAIVLVADAAGLGGYRGQTMMDRAWSILLFSEPGNAVKLEQIRVLMAHIAERPLTGWGFGAIAPDYRFGQIYSYEVGYVDLAYKTGILGLITFLSFPMRLVFDGMRARFRRLRLPHGMSPREAAVPVAILCSVLVLHATNPYLVGAFGLASVVLAVVWLDPFDHATARAAPDPASVALAPSTWPTSQAR